jgi:phosphatidylglycerophosphatase A
MACARDSIVPIFSGACDPLNGTKTISSSEAKGKPPGWRFLVASPWYFIALGFGTGLSPVAPGTVGSLPGLILGLGLVQLPLPLGLALLAGVFIIGVVASSRTATALGVHDHGAIVVDEIVGMALVVVAGPAGPLFAIAGFVFFRLFDILKPWPIGPIDRQVQGGFGVMLDDVLAALYAVAVIHLLALAI